MEENTNKKEVSIGMTVGVAILAAIVFGAGAYLYANNQATQEKETLNTQIITLQNEVSDAKKAAEVTSNSSTGATTVTDAWATYTDTAFGFSFKYPKDLVVTLAKVKDVTDPSTIFINKSENVKADGSYTADVSVVSISVRDSSYFADDTGSQVAINSPSGKLTATYMTDEAPMGYTYYVYEFQKDGKFYMFRMNNYNSDGKTILMTADQFKQLVDTITFN